MRWRDRSREIDRTVRRRIDVAEAFGEGKRAAAGRLDDLDQRTVQRRINVAEAFREPNRSESDELDMRSPPDLGARSGRTRPRVPVYPGADRSGATSTVRRSEATHG
jgi:hypothetical protein